MSQADSTKYCSCRREVILRAWGMTCCSRSGISLSPCWAPHSYSSSQLHLAGWPSSGKPLSLRSENVWDTVGAMGKARTALVSSRSQKWGTEKGCACACGCHLSQWWEKNQEEQCQHLDFQAICFSAQVPWKWWITLGCTARAIHFFSLAFWRIQKHNGPKLKKTQHHKAANGSRWPISSAIKRFFGQMFSILGE